MNEMPERFLQTVPGWYIPASGDFEAHGPGEFLRGALLLQPEKQHEGAGGSLGCSGCRGATATLRLLQVRNVSVFSTDIATRLYSTLI